MHTHLKSFFAACLASVAAISWADTEITGYVSQITMKHVEIEGKRYPLLQGDSQDMRSTSPRMTQCWAGERTTCGTLAGIGYIHRARVVLRDGAAIRVEVLEMRQ
ncbi:MAG TPA: hypothetical protein PKH69_05025 [Thiobacillaceae bacterium]|nr:hypothetical protein [Thiobacillaceae bacterium]HNU65227.1 hypothetical protein [Thiobacillaceae bacterium]